MSAALRTSLRAKWGAGQPIIQMLQLALANPNLISLAAGFVDGPTLPVEPMRKATEALLADPRLAQTALQYGTTPGCAKLRSQVIERLVAADGAPACERSLSTDQVVLTAGSNQFLQLLCDMLLNPGDIVLCPSPTYFVFLGMLASVGARGLGVPVDEEGVIPAGLEEVLEGCAKRGELNRVKGIYLVSYFDNPTNVTLSAERRKQIVEIAKRWSARAGKIYVIEDVAYRLLRYTGEDPPSMRSYDDDGETVILADTFSKSFSPGVRVGWGIMPPEIAQTFAGMKGNIDFGSPTFPQYVMSKVLELGLFDPHVEKLRANYQRKLNVALEAADEFLAPIEGVHYERPTGGIYLWLTLPEHVDAGPDGPLLKRALDQGVLYVPGGYCFPLEGAPVQKNTIRLSIGDQEGPRIRQGIELLAKAIEVAAGSKRPATSRA